MSKNLVVIGFGPGNATAVAEKFGAEGFSVGLVGRDEDRLAAGVSTLKARGIANAFPADAADPAAIRGAINGLRAELGPITVIHWTPTGAPRREVFSPPTPLQCVEFSTSRSLGLSRPSAKHFRTSREPATVRFS